MTCDWANRLFILVLHNEVQEIIFEPIRIVNASNSNYLLYLSINNICKSIKKISNIYGM